MSRGSWRGAEALQKRRREDRAIRRANERERLRRAREIEDWHITGEPAFRPKERSYPHGGGADGAACAAFLRSAERAMHLFDRGKTVTMEMSAALACLERKHSALVHACNEFEDKHSSHLYPERIESGNWEVGAKELRLFVDAAQRMTSAQRLAFTDVLAPSRDKREGYIGPVDSLAARLQRAKQGSIEQAVSGVLFESEGRAQGTRRFAREVRATAARELTATYSTGDAATTASASSASGDSITAVAAAADLRPSSSSARRGRGRPR